MKPLRLYNYTMKPDNGSTWALTKIETNKETGQEYEGSTIYPRNLQTCLERVRESLHKESEAEDVQNLIDDYVLIDGLFLTELSRVLNEAGLTK